MMPTEDLLTTLKDNVRRSADNHGSSNEPVAEWIEIATLRIQTQSTRIEELEDLLGNVMEHHGLSTGL